MMDLVTVRASSLGHLVLNRPAALNALTHDMIRGARAAFAQWRDDPTVVSVLVSGAGERGLCAGGDIVGIYASVRDDGSEAAALWADEYAMNAEIAHYPKPFVALMDGIVLGGGVGISAHGSVRIVTERTRLGMPEVGIGFTPDVGGTWLLSRAPGELGTHAAVTGGAMTGSDAITLGLADHFVPSPQLATLVRALENEPADAVIHRFAEEPPPSILVTERDWIDEAYAGDDPAAIVDRLDASTVPAARDAAATIRSKSPTSVAVALEAMRRAKALDSLEEVLNQDYRLALRFLEGHDLAEGIRAQVIDKDRTPSWSPSTLAAVSRADVEHYFADLGPRELGLSPTAN
ncbi:MAG: enoyl-CoA hydratase/isomerase family protein [Pseudolysinimonas sp.]